MHKHKIILLMIVVVTAVLVMSGFFNKAFAPPAPGCCGSHISGQPTPLMTMPPPMPPGFPYKWVNDDLIKRLTENKLEVEYAEPMSKVAHINLPINAMEVTKFSIPSFGENMGGYILSFEKKNDLEKVRKQYLKLNEMGKHYTWSFVKDNIILVMAGIVPEVKARLYEDVLYDLNKK